MDGGYALGEGTPPPSRYRTWNRGRDCCAWRRRGPFQEGNPQSTQCPNLSERKEAGEKEMKKIFFPGNPHECTDSDEMEGMWTITRAYFASLAAFGLGLLPDI